MLVPKHILPSAVALATTARASAIPFSDTAANASLGNAVLSPTSAYAMKRSPETAYESARVRGQALYNALSQPGQAGVLTRWDNADRQFAESGWTQYLTIPHEVELEQCVRPVLRAGHGFMSIDDMYVSHYIQDRPYMMDGKQWPPTGTEYKNYYGPGIIISLEGTSPSIRRGQPGPKLTKWSDVAMLTYHKLYLTDPEKAKDNYLQSFLQCGVIDGGSSGIINQLKKKLKIPKQVAFPGNKFEPGQEGFDALLGTRDGEVVAHAIYDHRPNLGWFTISDALMWSDNFGTPSIWYKIVGEPGTASGVRVGVPGSSSASGSRPGQQRGGSSRGQKRSRERGTPHGTRADRDDAHEDEDQDSPISKRAPGAVNTTQAQQRGLRFARLSESSNSERSPFGSSNLTAWG
ncbi:Hypothetical predicted protein [Lecanosticta acicola]|uniref:Uncharacterized protein n=1 Tax=Lecanosticta acicola TaxID=111012 RepID=A0AAI8Z9K3_9PEZI|nr:Hypothetical predicted protein [Lecanosticta acicola]